MLENQEILKMAKLARLHVSDSEVEDLKTHLQAMLQYMENLQSLDLSSVEPMTAVEEPSTVLRDDVPGQSLSKEKAFENAPRVEQNHFVIPKVMG